MKSRLILLGVFTAFSCLTSALLLLPTMVLAQQQEPINLKVSTPEAETIWKALRKLPVEEVEQLMAKIRQQVVEQTQPKPAVEEKKDVPTPSKPPN